MKVYFLIFNGCSDFCDIIGVYKNKVSAIKKQKSLESNDDCHSSYEYYEIKELDLIED